jgi:hypothetical protein
MRFMIIVKANADTEAGVMPSFEQLEAMNKFNEDIIKAGILLGGEGLQSSAKGARVRREGDKMVVTDGPFAETKELVAGFWLMAVKDKAEAIEWARRIPLEDGQEVEIRQAFEAADFTNASDELIAKEEAWRAENQKPITK